MDNLNRLAEVIHLDNGHYQGDCAACGWHTRECNSKQWTEGVVTFHHSTCPAKLTQEDWRDVWHNRKQKGSTPQ